ncbi:MAG: sulfite reductase flavoprotein subunit alpha, partial [Myxococcota bacterium]
LTVGAKPGALSRDNPYEAKVIEARKLNGAGSSKETMHYVIDLGDSGISFQGGDSFGVLPTNPPEEVAGILEASGLDAESSVRTADGRTLALRGVLARRCCLQHTSPEFLRRVAADGGPGAEALAQGEAAVTAYLKDRFVLDVLRDHDALLDGQTLVDLLRPLPPRLYSVTSSPKVSSTTVDFLVETLRYERVGRPCEGVASVWLADRCTDQPVPLYLVANPNFRLPADDADIIMIGPGTGLAPFRAFLQERQKTSAKGRNWLFFGHQHEAHDFLYKDELASWESSGLLTKADYAWSRDQEHKVYVQDKIRAAGGELWTWIEGGAHIFVCGDASGMAPGVDEALRDVAVTHGGMDAAQAKAYVKKLITDDRYHRDVY